MCFFNSLTANAAAVAKKYGKRMDIIEAVRKILAENEQYECAAQDKDPSHKTSIYSIRLAEGMYNIPAYAEPHCVIVSGSEQLQAMQWGLIPRSAKVEDMERYNTQNLFKNARADGLFEKWPWRMLWAHNRCVIPSTGFFEPHHDENGKSQYYHIRLKNRDIFSMAGLWDEWTDPRTGEKSLSFVMITTDANPMMRKIHNSGNNPFRMPKILTEEEEKVWLDPTISAKDTVEKLLSVYPDTDMIAWPVKQKFNYGNPYDESIIDEVPSQGKLDFQD